MMNKTKFGSVAAVILAALSACSAGKDEITFRGNMDEVPSTVRFEYGAYNLATDTAYNSAPLITTVRNWKGDTLDLPVNYSVSNAAIITVDSVGKLRAVGAGTGVLVRASVTYNGITRTDSAYVNVVAGVPRELVQRIAFGLAAGDSAKYGHTAAFPRGKTIQVIRQGVNGGNLNTIRVALRTSNHTIARLTHSATAATATINREKPGITTFTIEAFAYGTGFRDSIEYIIGLPIAGVVNWIERFPSGGTPYLDPAPKRLVVGVGACVSWYNALNNSLEADVIFENTEDVSSPQSYSHCNVNTLMDLNPGNIPAWKATSEHLVVEETVRSRVFKKPGTYKYRSAISGTTGEIFVCDEANDTTCAPSYR